MMTQRASGSRRLPASAWVFDSALALVAAGLTTAFFVSEPMASGLPRGTLALGYALALLHTLPLAARRRFPGTVLGISVASGLAFAAIGLPPFFLGPAMLVAVYSVAAYGSWWVAVAGLAVAEVGLVAVQLTPVKHDALTVVVFTGFLAVAWLLGRFAHNYRAYAARLEERTAELEQAREELARRAVVEERLRLARELHDVVAHAMSVIAVQSGVGAHVADSRPEEVGRSLAAIEATSRPP
jgi:signal transduction histidine kinase